MNEENVQLAKQKITILQRSISNGNHIKTGDIRKLSAKLYILFSRRLDFYGIFTNY